MSLRKQAAARGATVYDSGRECKHCGGTERYVSNGACPACHGHNSKLPDERHLRRLEGRENKARAILRGDKRYIGSPCKNCGGVERLVSNSGCVECQTSAARRRQENERARYHNETSALLWLQEAPDPEYADLYALCPEIPPGWRVVYSDLPVSGFRTFTGREVFARPEVLVYLANACQRGASGDQFETARRLIPAIVAAMRRYNLSLHGRFTHKGRKSQK